MSDSTFRALVVKTPNTEATVETLDVSQLPTKGVVRTLPGDCDTLIKVDYSNINYKDARYVTGKWHGYQCPMVGGIDLIGTVMSTTYPGLKVGQQIVINGLGIGTDHFGGFAEKASVCGKWCLPLDQAGNIGALDAARLGTAGYTAMLCMDKLTKVVKPEDGPIVVTGATGGVGGVAVSLLSHLGYHVVAVTGKVEQESDYLKQLGAKEILPRSHFSGDPKPLGDEKWAGAVDTVGGKILANIISEIKYGGAAAICGLVAGQDLPTTVLPFILRDVTMFGIDCVYRDLETRRRVYAKYFPMLKENKALELINTDQIIGLDQVVDIAKLILKGQHKGRYVVKL